MALVVHSRFDKIGKTGNGGVFDITNFNLSVTCCSFSDDYVTDFGGCICITNGELDIIKTSFLRCYSSHNQDEISGNAAYVNQKEMRINCSSTLQCGPSSSKCSDSSIRCTKSLAIVDSLNATLNHGSDGSSALAVDYSVSGTIVKYIQGVEGVDAVAVQSWMYKYPINMSNFINCSKNNCIVWIDSDDVIEFNDCVFWKNAANGFSSHGRRCIFNNCVADFEISGVIKTNELVTKIVKIEMKCSVKEISRINTCATHIPKLTLYLYMVVASR